MLPHDRARQFDEVVVRSAQVFHAVDEVEEAVRHPALDGTVDFVGDDDEKLFEYGHAESKPTESLHDQPCG